jgi:hypothetical protein
MAVVFEEAGFIESFKEMLFQIAHLNFARDADQFGTQVEGGLDTVKAFQSGHQRGRNQQCGVGIMVRVADVKPGMLFVGGRDEIKIEAKARKNV